MSPVSGDLLSAASLLTAVVGVFFALWSGEIDSEIAKPVPLHDRDPEITAARRALWLRAAPLALASAGLVAILSPPAVQIVGDVVDGDWGDYDPVQACYVAMVVLLIGLVALSVGKVVGLLRRLRRLR